jgi:hypothetical protein
MKSGKKSQTVSYGHDIEAAWLIEEAAGIIKNKSLLQQARQYAVILAIAAIDGLDTDGGLWYEYDITKMISPKKNIGGRRQKRWLGFLMHGKLPVMNSFYNILLLHGILFNNIFLIKKTANGFGESKKITR